MPTPAGRRVASASGALAIASLTLALILSGLARLRKLRIRFFGADLPGVVGQYKQLDLAFRSGSFRSGDLLSFGIDRDEADAAGPNVAAGGNSADLLGGGVLIPSGNVVPGGASFFGR